MAFFDSKELLDLIRHEMRCVDESTATSSVILPVTRRAKYGGLPLGFRAIEDDGDDDELHDEYLIPFHEADVRTKDLIQELLESRSASSERKRGASLCQEQKANDAELFIPKKLEDFEAFQPRTSDLTNYIRQNEDVLDNPLNIYAELDGAQGRGSRQMRIFFPGGKQHVKVSVAPTTKGYEVIGLSLLRYLEMNGKELPGSVDQYDLVMAEDDGDIDDDFPALERGRPMGELGFNTLALVRNSKRSEEHVITVYFTSGQQYDITAKNLDLTFGWLINEATKRLDEDEEYAKSREGLVPIREYTIESLEGKQWSPNASLSSAGRDREFVLIRKNSSRAGFHPHQPTEVVMRPNKLSVFTGRQLSSYMGALSPNSPAPSTGRLNSDYLSRHSREFSFNMTPMALTSFEEQNVFTFVVERMHTFKKNWRADLVIGWTDWQLKPFGNDAERRKSFLPQQYQKASHAPWECVGEIEPIMKSTGFKNKDTLYIIKFHWLRMPEGIGRNELTLDYLSKLDETHVWKRVRVNCRSREEWQEITTLAESYIANRQSEVRTAWQHSLNGQLNPAESAQAALLDLENHTDRLSQTMPTTSARSGRFHEIASRLINGKKRNGRRLSGSESVDNILT